MGWHRALQFHPVKDMGLTQMGLEVAMKHWDGSDGSG